MRKPLHETMFSMLGIVMAVVYVALGITLAATPLGETVFPEGTKVLIGVVIIVYGAFRMYRAIRQMVQ